MNIWQTIIVKINFAVVSDAVEHSAKNETRAGGKIGHQTIHVYLKKLPSTVTHLYFTLSSWRSPNLSAFSNPSLQFYEASDSSTNLCSTTIGHALDSQAVIMCYMVRVSSQWQIFECDVGSLVNGNSKRYNPIRQRISELIKSSKEWLGRHWRMICLSVCVSKLCSLTTTFRLETGQYYYVQCHSKSTAWTTIA